MASHANGHAEIRNPGNFEASGTMKGVFALFALIGIAAFAGGLVANKQHAWASFVQNHFFFLSLALGGIFLSAIQFITGAMWSAPVRRLMESLTAYLPAALVMFIVLIFGMHELYVWTHPEHVKGDIMLEHKASYLNVTFFVIRNLVAFGLWLFFAKKMVGNSVAQDADKNPVHTAKNRLLAPFFFITFAVTFTMAAFDILMSLDPHWFSTMFGVYCFAGLFYSSLALTCLLAIFFIKNGKLQGIVNDNHLHDLGKFMFGFSVFYAYIAFSQFMLIWYANMPEETGYFLRRMHSSWFYVSAFLVFGKFLVPFFLLMRREAKRTPVVLVPVAIFMLAAQWIDMLWLVQPEFFKEGPRLSWIDAGVTLGFVGIFGLMLTRFFAKNGVLAIGDPRLSESVFHHHQ